MPTDTTDGARARGGIPATVMLRPIASGLPIGFFGLVIASVLVATQAYGILPVKAAPAIGLLLLPTVVAQFVGGISAILARTVIGASLMTIFSGVWLGTALVDVVHPADGLHVLAIWYFGLGAVIVCFISSATGKLAVALVPLTGLPAFMVAAAWLLGGGKSHFLGEVAGVLTFLLAAAGLYAGWALLLEDARRRTVLPTLRRGPMKDVFTKDFTAQLEDIEHEAGVRRYL